MFKVPKYYAVLSSDSRWINFLYKWNASSEPEEAVGWLNHAANKMHESHCLRQNQEEDILRFFIFQSEQSNDGIAKIAQQLLIGKVLKNWKCSALPGSDEIHAELIRVFNSPTQPLVSGKYYDGIYSYLHFFRMLLIDNAFYHKAPVSCSDEIQHLFEPYVRMAINWGFVSLVHSEPQSPFYRIVELEAILEDHLNKTKMLYGTISMDRRITDMFSGLHLMDFSVQPKKMSGYPYESKIDLDVFLLLMELRLSICKLDLPKGQIKEHIDAQQRKLQANSL